VLLTRTERLESSLGKRLDDSTQIEYQAPTVWASIAVLGGLLEEVKISLAQVPEYSQLERRISEGLAKLETQTVGELQQTMDVVDSKIGRVNETVTNLINLRSRASDGNILLLAKGAAKLKEDIENLRRGSGSLQNSPEVSCDYGWYGG
jgi:hypothetical protein